MAPHPPVSDCVIGMCLSISLTFPFFNVNPSHANSTHASGSLQQKCNLHPNLTHSRGSRVGSQWVSKAALKYSSWEQDAFSYLMKWKLCGWMMHSFKDPALNVQIWSIIILLWNTHLSCIPRPYPCYCLFLIKIELHPTSFILWAGRVLAISQLL